MKHRRYLIIIMTAILLLTCSCKIIGCVIPLRVKIDDYTKVDSFEITNCIYKEDSVYEHMIIFKGATKTIEKQEWVDYGPTSDVLESKVLSDAQCEELSEIVNEANLTGLTYDYSDSFYYYNNGLLLLPDELYTMSNDENNNIKKLFLAIDARFFGNR